MHRILALASQMLSYLAKFGGDTVAVSYNLRCTDRAAAWYLLCSLIFLPMYRPGNRDQSPASMPGFWHPASNIEVRPRRAKEPSVPEAVAQAGTAEELPAHSWVVVSIMVPFWVLNIIRHLMFRVTILTTTQFCLRVPRLA